MLCGGGCSVGGRFKFRRQLVSTPLMLLKQRVTKMIQVMADLVALVCLHVEVELSAGTYLST